MYIVKKTSTTVDVFFNAPIHAINWATVAPGKLVVQLPEADFKTVSEWASHGHFTAGTPPALIADTEGREPEADGYVETFDEGVPGVWESDANKVVVVPDGRIELQLADGSVQQTIDSGTVVQFESP